MKKIDENIREEFKKKLVEVLAECGEDVNREGLEKTPERYTKFLEEFLTQPEFEMTTFDNEGYDEMIVQSDIPFYSLCEHHLVPFFGTAVVAYIPDKKIVGLSKLARTVEHFSHKLQNQERLTMEVANYLEKLVKPQGVAVSINARHLCMEMLRLALIWSN